MSASPAHLPATPHKHISHAASGGQDATKCDQEGIGKNSLAMSNNFGELREGRCFVT